MTALIVTGAILALLLLLLLSPIVFDMAYRQGEFSLVLRYIVYRRALAYESLTKKTAKEAEAETGEETGKKQEETGEGKAKGAKETLATVWELVKHSRKGLSILRRHLVFSRVRVYLRVGCPDAHQTALRTGQIGAAVQAALDIVRMIFVLRRPDVVILPDFTQGDTRGDIRLRVSIRLIFVLAAVASVLRRFLRARQQDNKKTDQQNRSKVVEQNERAASSR